MQVYAWTVGPALTLWDLVIEVFHSVPNRTYGPKRELRWNSSAIVKSNMHNSIRIKHTNVIPKNTDHIPSNTKNSDSSATLYVFEGQWGGNQNDYQRLKSHNATCFTDPQSLLWTGCLTKSIWTIRSRSGTLPWSGKIYEKTIWRSCGRLECEFGYLVNVHEYHSSSSCLSRKKIREEPYLGLSGTIIWRKKQTDLWTVRIPWSRNTRDRWFESNWTRGTQHGRSIRLLCEGVCQIIAAKVCVFSDSVLCLGKIRRQSCWILEEQQLFQQIDSNWWTTCGIRVEDFLRIHYSGESSVRFNRWWENYCVNQRTSQAGSSSCQCLTTLYVMQNGNDELCVNNSKIIKEYVRRFTCLVETLFWWWLVMF